MTIIKENQNTTKLISLLKHSEKQYPPLSKEQEQELIKKYKNDRNKLNELLFMHNIKLVFNMAKKYVTKTKSFDDLVQNGFIGLAEATKRFDINRNIKFITYASQWIRKYILNEFYGNEAELDRSTFSLDSPLSYNSDEDSASTVENIIHNNIEASITINDYKDEYLKNEYKDIYNTLNTSITLSTELSANEKNMFTDIFYNREKLKDIATKYNIDNKTVLKIKTKLLNFCKDVLQNKLGIYSKEDLFSY